MTVPAIDRDILIARFQRVGGDSELTRQVVNLLPDDRNLLLREAAPHPDEEPLVAYVGGSEDWLLLTTRRILYAGPDGRRSFRIVDLVSVGHDKDRLLGRHGLDKTGRRKSKAKHPGTSRGYGDFESSAEFVGRWDKRLWRELTIESCDGERIEADVEPGAATFVLWNTLLWVCRWGTAQRERGLN